MKVKTRTKRLILKESKSGNKKDFLEIKIYYSKLITQWLVKWFVRLRKRKVISVNLEGFEWNASQVHKEKENINKIFKSIEYKMRKYDEYLIEDQHGDNDGNT